MSGRSHSHIKLTNPTKETAAVTTRRGLPHNNRYKPAPRFVYAHYPTAWTFDIEFGFLPKLAKIIAKPGVNGVPDNGSLTAVLTGVSSKGGTYIDPKDERLGDYMDYVQYYECDSGAKWYVDFCQEATVLPNGEILWNTKDTERKYKEFLAHIRDSGILEPMHAEVMHRMEERERRRLSTLHSRLDRNPHLAGKAAESEKRLDGMPVAFAKWSQYLAKSAKPSAKVK